MFGLALVPAWSQYNPCNHHVFGNDSQVMSVQAMSDVM